MTITLTDYFAYFLPYVVAFAILGALSITGIMLWQALVGLWRFLRRVSGL